MFKICFWANSIQDLVFESIKKYIKLWLEVDIRACTGVHTKPPPELQFNTLCPLLDFRSSDISDMRWPVKIRLASFELTMTMTTCKNSLPDTILRQTKGKNKHQFYKVSNTDDQNFLCLKQINCSQFFYISC